MLCSIVYSITGDSFLIREWPYVGRGGVIVLNCPFDTCLASSRGGGEQPPTFFMLQHWLTWDRATSVLGLVTMLDMWSAWSSSLCGAQCLFCTGHKVHLGECPG